jgi:hypothetical protein
MDFLDRKNEALVKFLGDIEAIGQHQNQGGHNPVSESPIDTNHNFIYVVLGLDANEKVLPC